MLDSEVFTLLMDNDPDVVVLKDESGKVLYANQAMLDLFAPEVRGEIVGADLAKLFGEEEANLFLAEDRRAFERGRTELVERITDHQGKSRVLQTKKLVCPGPDGTRRLLVIATDITELSERESSLVAAKDKLKRFSAFAAHDLRSPLATFVSAMGVIRDDEKTTLSPQAAEYLELMIASAGHLADNVTAMLSVADVDDTATVEFTESDLNLVVEEVRFNLSDLVQRTGATISSVRLPRIVCEPGLFRQLLQNLVENAIKNRSDEPLHVLVRYERSGEFHRFFVEDNGLGVSAKAARTIFEPFTQGERAPANGVGIGLALCRRIVEIHAGDISVDTGFETGCRIEVRLPIDPAAALNARRAA